MKTLLSISLLLSGATLSSADNRTQDVESILKSQSERKFLRCVLNERSRCLAIHLSPKLSVAYDTQNGALAFAWKPKDPANPINLVGAVFTGRHGPQPLIAGKILFEEKATQYTCSNKDAKLRYLGHSVDKQGDIQVKFAFQNDKGEHIAEFTEQAKATSAPDSGKTQLTREVSVIKIAPDATLSVAFPKELLWENTTGHTASINAKGTTSYTSTLNF